MQSIPVSVSKQKKVILIIIDSLNPAVVRDCLEQGMVPGLEFLVRRGRIFYDCVSVFPTMTPTCTSSIVTGTYPDLHQVPGFVWFSRWEKRMINYGASFTAIWKLGLPTVMQDLIFNLNGRQLSRRIKTVYELLEDQGLTTAAINFYIFRGRQVFETRIPWLINLLTRFRLAGRLMGPSLLVLGEICRPARLFKDDEFWAPAGPLNKFGVNDEFSGTVTSYLISHGHQPPLMLVYLPDNDGYCHRHDPLTAYESLMRADRQICKILDAYPSWEQALAETVFIVTGDHSQSRILNSPVAIIDLPALLAPLKQVPLGRKLALPGKDIAIAPNERAAHIYILRRKPLKRARVMQKLLELLEGDSRIDLILWKEEWQGMTKFWIKNGNRALWFVKGGTGRDLYGNSWHWEGDLSAIDARVEGQYLKFGQYPDAFRRISALLRSRNAGDVVITAAPGYEFGGLGSPLHLGFGSHGSLHAVDSLVPLIVCGAEWQKEHPRLVDLVPWLLKYFGIPYPDYLVNEEGHN
ncbi:alkaline phosphatase family protein [Carboxydocella sp. ULO1]|uniref:alkaline phosphatase family protein n=1 Tax=Carboxydocella sp. ULO1 TaxID=1926599 RepID=UPI0009AC3A4A|nr:alkaline phosphatase family protein [Carboxydocella sp. ULO1]GAW30132.1 hypothetical protein ULO1_27020 [Carboxydocella sp. ULO1]